MSCMTWGLSFHPPILSRALNTALGRKGRRMAVHLRIAVHPRMWPNIGRVRYGCSVCHESAPVRVTMEAFGGAHAAPPFIAKSSGLPRSVSGPTLNARHIDMKVASFGELRPFSTREIVSREHPAL